MKMAIAAGKGIFGLREMTVPLRFGKTGERAMPRTALMESGWRRSAGAVLHSRKFAGFSLESDVVLGYNING